MSHGSGDPRMVKLAELWERTSARGTRYFSGFLGDAQILMFDAGEREHPTKPGETVHVWRLMVQERDPARRPGASYDRTGGTHASGLSPREDAIPTTAPAKAAARGTPAKPPTR